MSGSKRRYKKDEKDLQLLVLQQMLAAKDVLFGKFGGVSQTKSETEDAWKKIANAAVGYGLVNETNPEKFRRITWQNWRRSTMNKMDRMKKTGVGGAGPSDLLDEGDKILLAIVGEDVAFVFGRDESNGNITSPPEEESIRIIYNPQPSVSQRKTRKKKKSSEKLKRELIKTALYKTRLEARALEVSLDLCFSKCTNKILETSSSSSE